MERFSIISWAFGSGWGRAGVVVSGWLVRVHEIRSAGLALHMNMTDCRSWSGKEWGPDSVGLCRRCNASVSSQQTLRCALSITSCHVPVQVICVTRT